MGVKNIPFIDVRRIGLSPDEFWDPNSGIGHPLIREDWKTQDSLLGALGLHFWYGSFSHAPDEPPKWRWADGPGAGGGNWDLDRQLDGYGPAGETTIFFWNGHRTSPFILNWDDTHNKLELKYRSLSDNSSGTWRNRYNQGTTTRNWPQNAAFEDLLRRENNGDPYFKKYIQDGFDTGDDVDTAAVKGILQAHPSGSSSLFTDTTIELPAPGPDSENASGLSDPNFNISINPVYNGYSRVLEEVFSETGLGEESIPNYYMMHYRPRNDAAGVTTVSLPDVYKDQINLSPYTTSTWVGGPITEGTPGSYFDQYENNLREILSDPAVFTNVNEYMQRYKTIAIRPSSLAGIEDLALFPPNFGLGLGNRPDMLGDDDLRDLSYYIEINFTEPLDATGNPLYPSDYADYLWDNDLYDSAMSFNLELLAGANPWGGPGHLRQHQYGTTDGALETIPTIVGEAADTLHTYASIGSIDPSNGNPSRLWETQNQIYNNFGENIQCYLWGADLSGLHQGHATGAPKGTFLIAPEYYENTLEQSSRVGDIPSQAGFEADVLALSEWPGQKFNSYVRSTEDLLKGKGSYTETLIYKIEKRRVVDGTPGPVVQTFYIPRVPGRNGFRYIDSQVFYGIQYQYDISPINLVIGSAWTYNDILLHYGGSLQLGTGHALGNALGFYLETGPPALVHPPATGAHLEESEDTQIAVATVPDNTELAGTFVFKLPSSSQPSSGQGPDVLSRLVGQDLNVPNSQELFSPTGFGWGSGSAYLISDMWHIGADLAGQGADEATPSSHMRPQDQWMLLKSVYLNLISGQGITNNINGGAEAYSVEASAYNTSQLDSEGNPAPAAGSMVGGPHSGGVPSHYGNPYAPGGLGWALDIVEYDDDFNEMNAFTVNLDALPLGVISVSDFIEEINTALEDPNLPTGRGYAASAAIDKIFLDGSGEMHISFKIECVHGGPLDAVGNPAPKFQIRFHTGPTNQVPGFVWDYEDIAVSTRPSNIRAPRVNEFPPYYSTIATVQDKPPMQPDVEFIPFRNVSDRIMLSISGQTGAYWDSPVYIEPEDSDIFRNIYIAQGHQDPVAAQLSATPIEFRTDDPTTSYQIFRTVVPPELYSDFQGFMLAEHTQYIANDRVAPLVSFMDDTILPNTKYYYCFRAIDVHGNLSNPSPVYQFEMVDNDGQIYPIIEIYQKCADLSGQSYAKTGKRFVYIAPSTRQTLLNLDDDWSNLVEGQPAPDNLLGAPGVDKVWNNIFKVRITSKKTGRKVDLNLIFKNTGVIEP